MIRLLTPPFDDVVDDLVEFCLESHRPGGRRLSLNMVSSLDGATAMAGETAPLSDDDDRALFIALRAAADVILVGAGTVRAEDYGPVRLPAQAREARHRRGLPELPRIAVVSRSLRLDGGSRLFSERAARPYVLTGEDSSPSRREALSEHAEVVVAGRGGAKPGGILDFLWREGHEVILCEGGPTLNGELATEDLIDEINLTVSPQIVGGESDRIVRCAALTASRFHLDRLMSGDRMLFARYLRDRP